MARLRPRAQPHPRHRRQLQQPVRRAAAPGLHRHLGDAQPGQLQRPRRPAQPLARSRRPAAARWARSTCCATRSSSSMVDEQQRAAPVPRGAGRRRAWWWPTSPPGRSHAGPSGPVRASTSPSTTGDRSAACDVSTDPLLRRRRLQQLHRRGRRPDGLGLLHPGLRRAAGQDQEPGPRAVRVGDRRQPAGHRHDRLRPAGRHRRADHDRRLPPARPTRCSTPAPTRAASTSTSTRPTGCTSTSSTSSATASRHPVLHGRDPLAGRRRARSRRGVKLLPGRRHRRRPRAVDLHVPAVQHRHGRPGAGGSTRRT